MVVLKLPYKTPINYNNENYDDGVPTHLWEKDLSFTVSTFNQPLDKENVIHTRLTPTCLESVLRKMAKRINKTNMKTVTACSMEWGRSKLMSIPEYKSILSDRDEKANTAINSEYARAYRSRNTEGLFKRILDMEHHSKPYNIQTTESVSNWVRLNAPTLLMSEYELGIFLLCIGLMYGDQEEKYDERFRLLQWEKDNMLEIILKSQEHLLTLEDQIRHFEYVQSIKGTNLF